MKIRDRIKELRRVKASELLPNPKNWRTHPTEQADAMWEYDRASSNDYHPTQKPVDVAVRAIRNSSGDGDIVLDLFLGGGTTMVAADQLGRRCFGIEIEPKYCAVILERMSDMGCEPKLTEAEVADV